MTGGEIAAIIAAVAFAILAFTLVYVLIKVAGVVEELNKTIENKIIRLKRWQIPCPCDMGSAL